MGMTTNIFTLNTGCDDRRWMQLTQNRVAVSVSEINGVGDTSFFNVCVAGSANDSRKLVPYLGFAEYNHPSRVCFKLT